MRVQNLTKEQQFVLTPRTEEKYQKINQDFAMMMERNNINRVNVRI